MSEIKDRVKSMRKSLKLSQSDFAERLGLTGASISRYEDGSREISDAVIKHIAKTFRISETWLRTGEGEMEEPDVMADLVARFHLGPAGQALLRAAARALAELDEAAAYALIDDVIAELRSARQAQAEARTRNVEALIDSRLTEDLPPDTKAQ